MLADRGWAGFLSLQCNCWQFGVVGPFLLGRFLLGKAIDRATIAVAKKMYKLCVLSSWLVDLAQAESVLAMYLSLSCLIDISYGLGLDWLTNGFYYVWLCWQ